MNNGSAKMIERIEQDVLPPWFASFYQQQSQAFFNGQMAHASLLVGPKGTAKSLYFQHLAKHMLCLSAKDNALTQACGQCKSCHLFDSMARQGSHPDCLLVRPEGKSSDIRIDQVRAIQQFCEQTSQVSPVKVIIINTVNDLNAFAANALLKLLEEPNAGCYFLLAAENMAKLLPTIKSRVQWTRCPEPSVEQLQQWLHGQGFSTLQIEQAMDLLGPKARLVQRFLHLEDDEQSALRSLVQQLSALKSARLTSLELAEQWLALPVEFFGPALYRLMQRLVEAKMLGADQYPESFATLISNMDTQLLLKIAQQLAEMLDKFEQSYNLNQEILLMNWLTLWVE